MGVERRWWRRGVEMHGGFLLLQSFWSTTFSTLISAMTDFWNNWHRRENLSFSLFLLQSLWGNLNLWVPLIHWWFHKHSLAYKVRKKKRSTTETYKAPSAFQSEYLTTESMKRAFGFYLTLTTVCTCFQTVMFIYFATRIRLCEKRRHTPCSLRIYGRHHAKDQPHYFEENVTLL